MQAPVLGIWEEEASNPSLTADLCEEKRLVERIYFQALCIIAIFVRINYNALWVIILPKDIVSYLKKRITRVENVSSAG